MVTLVAHVIVQVEGDHTLEDIQDYLKVATHLDVDTESQGDMGIRAIEIDWNALTVIPVRT
jgi:hypothetical protein